MFFFEFLFQFFNFYFIFLVKEMQAAYDLNLMGSQASTRPIEHHRFNPYTMNGG